MTTESEDDPSIDSLLREAVRVPKLEPDRAGTELGRFRIEEKLGEGAMGIVYAAFDPKLGRRVALKVLPRAALDDDERRRRFLREARTAAAVHHPKLAAVFDAGEADGTVFIAMELVAGSSLRRRLDEAGGRLAVADAIGIAIQIAEGLGAAHEAGVTHRDLKPENVMVDLDGTAKVVDFGLAKIDTPDAREGSLLSTEEGKILGTPSYMSPEQAKGKRGGPPSDVFSLGVVLYELLTGARPFTGESSVDVLASIMRDVPAPPSRRATGIPRAIDRVVLRCLEKDPDARYANGHAVAHALARARVSRRDFRVLAMSAVAAGVLAVGVIASERGASDAAPAATVSAPAANATMTPSGQATKPTTSIGSSATPSTSASAPPPPPSASPASSAQRTPARAAPSVTIDPLAHQK